MKNGALCHSSNGKYNEKNNQKTQKPFYYITCEKSYKQIKKE